MFIFILFCEILDIQCMKNVVEEFRSLVYIILTCDWSSHDLMVISQFEF